MGLANRTCWSVLLLSGLAAVGCNRDPQVGEYKTFHKNELSPVEADATVAETGPLTPTPDPVSGGTTPAPGTAPETVASEPPADGPVDALYPLNLAVRPPTTAAAPRSDIVQNAAPAAEEPTGPREITLLVPEKSFAPEGREKALRVSYDDLDLLKVLNMDPVPVDAATHFPDWLRSLDGKQVRIRGFMYPTFEAQGIEQFVLARDNQICCFGRDPKVYDLIGVELAKGTTTDYIPNRPFDVVGTFKIDLVADGGKPFGLYWLSNAKVIPH